MGRRRRRNIIPEPGYFLSSPSHQPRKLLASCQRVTLKEIARLGEIVMPNGISKAALHPTHTGIVGQGRKRRLGSFIKTGRTSFDQLLSVADSVAKSRFGLFAAYGFAAKEGARAVSVAQLRSVGPGGSAVPFKAPNRIEISIFHDPEISERSLPDAGHQKTSLCCQLRQSGVDQPVYRSHVAACRVAVNVTYKVGVALRGELATQ
jgi:hypothetical protein